MTKKFFFLTKKDYEIKSLEETNFFDQILKNLKKDLIIKQKIFDNLKSKQSEESLDFLFQEYGENEMKSYIFGHFNILYFNNPFDLKIFLQEFNFKFENFESIKEKITKDSLKLMQFSKTIPIFFDSKNQELYIVSNSITTEKIENEYKSKFNAIKIIYIFSNKQIILDFFSSEFEDPMVHFFLENNQIRPSAKNLEYYLKEKKLSLILAFFCFISLCFLSSKFLIFILFLIGLIFFSVNFFKIFLTWNFFKNNENFDFPENIQSDYSNFQKYTILLPILNEEKSIIIQLISSIKSMNYPKHLLEIFFLVEDDDYICSSILESLKLDYIFSILTIPNFFPKTKAKACNFALNFCSGEFLTIFDADDIPEQNQLIKVLNEFEKNQNIASVQCILNSYNKEKNLLTKFYSTEYSLWFKCFLKSLNMLKMPLTLGGTSNHFKTSVMKEFQWDSHNVTEDAELGIFFWLKNQKVLISDSITMEEAPISILSWIKQRSRWIKGFLQTYFVYISKENFSHLNFSKKIKFLVWMNFFMFFPIISQFFVFLIPFKFILLKYFFKNHFFSNFLAWFYFFNFLFYYFGQIYILFLNSRNLLVKFNFFHYILFPFYSLLNIFSTYKAVWQFFTKPYYWEKTLHGLWNDKE